MAVESPASKPAVPAVPSSASKTALAADNMVAIDAPLSRTAPRAPSTRLHDTAEDLARLQDQLMEVLEENAQLRTEMDTWRMRAMAVTQQNKAS